MFNKPSVMNQAKYNLLCAILLILGALYFAWTNPIDSNTIVAQASLIPSPSLQKEQPIETLTSEQTTLPPEVKNAVLEDLSRRTNKTVAALTILEAQKQTWSDGCLGLAQPDELCTQVITPGWQVVVSDGQENWTYRTDNTGSLVKLE